MAQLPSIDIVSRSTAENIFCRGGTPYDHVISISDGGSDPPKGFPSYPARSIALFFDDFTQDMDQAKRLSYEPPLPMHMEAVIRFAKDIKGGETVLCHCNAGISRSSASAVAILASKLKPSAQSAQDIISYVLKIRDIIHPNRHLIRYADEQLGYQGNLVAAHAATFLGAVDLGFLAALEAQVVQTKEKTPEAAISRGDRGRVW